MKYLGILFDRRDRTLEPPVSFTFPEVKDILESVQRFVPNYNSDVLLQTLVEFGEVHIPHEFFVYMGHSDVSYGKIKLEGGEQNVC